MNLRQIIDYLKEHETVRANIAFHKVQQERSATFGNFPDFMHQSLRENLERKGILKLYSHQGQALELGRKKANFVVTTPTASGKTYCYLLPILQDKLENPHGRYLFLFPTKALAQDQLSLFRQWQKDLNASWGVTTFDGDTPMEERRMARKSGDFILTNPDMLHSGILPNHNAWRGFFENIRAVVIDEMHTYMGVFGSQVANVLRRMNRVFQLYHSQPQYIFSSATIANPKELAHNLTGKDFELIDQSGAPEGEKHFIFYNPPFIDQINSRQSAYRSAAILGELLIRHKVPTIFFARSRNQVEILATYLRNRLPPHLQSAVMGYRGGYLPLERRKIEADLRHGRILGVVSTNALELGIDIGMLSAVVSVGYPGRVSSLLQQFGRAGRQKDPALAIMIANQGPMDQYLMTHPEYFTESKGEAAIINPDNLTILTDHIKCAAFESRFHEDETYGGQNIRDFLEYLYEQRVLVKLQGYYCWAEQTYPATEISLRSGARDNFVIVDKTNTAEEKVIGEVDFFSAPMMIHDEAIYIHQGRHFFVEKLDWEKRQAAVVLVKNDYYTDAHQNVHIGVIQKDEVKQYQNITLNWGEVNVTTKATLYKKIKLETHENLGWGEIHTPEIPMHTQAAWLEWESKIADHMEESLRGSFLQRLSYVMRNLGPLIALCDVGDFAVMGRYRDVQFQQFALVFYDHTPGGVGLSYKLMSNLAALLEMAQENVLNCQCQDGCPACIGVFEPGSSLPLLAEKSPALAESNISNQGGAVAAVAEEIQLIDKRSILVSLRLLLAELSGVAAKSV